jgi:hypothetical protein
MDKERQLAENALNYLSTTDTEVVKLERAYKDLEQIHKETKAAVYMTSEGSIEARKAQAETSELSKTAWTNYMDAWQEWRTMVMRRDSAERRWEDWRSVNSARRQGQTV